MATEPVALAVVTSALSTLGLKAAERHFQRQVKICGRPSSDGWDGPMIHPPVISLLVSRLA